MSEAHLHFASSSKDGKCCSTVRRKLCWFHISYEQNELRRISSRNWQDYPGRSCFEYQEEDGLQKIVGGCNVLKDDLAPGVPLSGLCGLFVSIGSCINGDDWEQESKTDDSSP